MPSGKSYIGLTSLEPRLRINSHKRYAKNGGKLPLSYAIVKYNFDFDWEVLIQTKSHYQAQKLERYFIDYYDTLKFGYNCTAGGEGTTSLEPWNKGKKQCFSKNTLKKMSERKLGVKRGPHSESTKKKMRDAQKGIPRGPSPMKGISFTPEKRLRYAKARNAKEIEVYEAVMVRPKKRGQSAKYEFGPYIGTWLSQSKVAEVLSVSQGNVGSCLRGLCQQTNGYMFKYKEVK